MKRRRLLGRLSRGEVYNVAFADFVDLLEGFGFKLARTSGRHHIFSRQDIIENINLQPMRGEAKPYQIRQLLRLVERYNLPLED